jgi:shikimate kinase
VTPLVVLIGPPGSGKTTVGWALADARSVPFRDTDLDIEQVAGKKVTDIFIEDGEARFRELEREAVERALREHDGVLALGGGAVLDSTTRERLAAHRVVYLQVGLAAASERVGFNRTRPLLVVNPRAELKRLMDERKPLYEEVADIAVDTDEREPSDIATQIASWLEQSP